MSEKKIVILLGSKEFGDKNNPAVIAEALQANLGNAHDVRHYYFEDLVFHISTAERKIVNGVDGFDLKNAQLVLAFGWYPAGKRCLRDIAFTVGLYLQESGVPTWNQEITKQRSTTKLSTLWLLAREGIDVPRTVFSLNHTFLANAWTDSQAIVKAIATSRGRHNYLVHNHDELAQTLRDSAQVRFLVQEYISNDYDLRIVCIAGKPQLILKRQRTSDATHLNNTSQGAAATLVPLTNVPPQLLTDVETICRLLGRELAGVDYLVANDGSGRYICLEVNAIPQLTSGVFLQEKMQALSEAVRASLGKE